jgi:simple sugar transport system permease protein
VKAFVKTDFLKVGQRHFPSIGILVSLATIMIVFAIITPKFFKLDTLAGILTIAAELAVVCVPVALLLISGELDLSVGSNFAFAGVLGALLLNRRVNGLLTLVTVILFGILIGMTNGLLTTKLRLPSFIVTLGSMFTLRGLLLVITGGFPIAFRGQNVLLWLLNGKLTGEIRMSFIWLVLVVVCFHFILNKTRHGNWSLGCGGNADVAQALGIPVSRVKLFNFLLVGAMAAFGGMLSFARFGMAYPTLGEGLELEAIASAVLGGCALTGGFGTVFGASLGALLIASLRVGLVLVGAPAYWYRAFIGIILIIGIVMNKEVMRRLVGGGQ